MSVDRKKPKEPKQKTEEPTGLPPEDSDIVSKASSRRRSPSRRISPTAWGGIATIVAALLYAVFGPAVTILLQRTPVVIETSVAILTQTPTLMATNTLTPTSTLTPTLTATPLPIPCSNGFFACVFPQADTGKIFEFTSASSVTLTVDEQAQCALTTELGAKLTYEVTQRGTNAAWGVQWIDTFGYFDASSFTNFTFAVKGELGGETFLIGMKDVAGSPVTLESKDYVTVSSTKWQTVIIPISRFTYQGITINPSALDNVSFSFDDRHGSGTICIDDIAFTK